MAEFPPNAAPSAPYKNFKFRVKWDGQYVSGISKVSPLSRNTKVEKWRDGGDPAASHKSPGRTKFEPITLERGLTQDAAFSDWANQVWRFGARASGEVGDADFRKDIRIELLNEAGQASVAFNVFRCWPSDYVVLADPDSNCNAVLVERIRLENEGWERDTSGAASVEPK